MTNKNKQPIYENTKELGKASSSVRRMRNKYPNQIARSLAFEEKFISERTKYMCDVSFALNSSVLGEWYELRDIYTRESSSSSSYVHRDRELSVRFDCWMLPSCWVKKKQWRKEEKKHNTELVRKYFFQFYISFIRSPFVMKDSRTFSLIRFRSSIVGCFFIV